MSSGNDPGCALIGACALTKTNTVCSIKITKLTGVEIKTLYETKKKNNKKQPHTFFSKCLLSQIKQKRVL